MRDLEKGGPGYKVVCISIYNDDLAELDDRVDDLKARGATKASRSALIRCALRAYKQDDALKELKSR